MKQRNSATGNNYVLDACSLIAFVVGEPGRARVRQLLQSAEHDRVNLYLHKINLLEIYYDFLRRAGEETANQVLGRLQHSPIHVSDSITDDMLKLVAEIKFDHELSLADAVAAAYALSLNAKLVTADREFAPPEKSMKLKVLWYR